MFCWLGAVIRLLPCCLCERPETPCTSSQSVFSSGRIGPLVQFERSRDILSHFPYLQWCGAQGVVTPTPPSAAQTSRPPILVSGELGLEHPAHGRGSTPWLTFPFPLPFPYVGLTVHSMSPEKWPFDFWGAISYRMVCCSTLAILTCQCWRSSLSLGLVGWSFPCGSLQG